MQTQNPTPFPAGPAEQPEWPEGLGARVTGPASGRAFDPERAGGPLEELSLECVSITADGVARVEEHLARFEADQANAVMVERLQMIAAGELKATEHDVKFYAHELREYERYKKMGWKHGQPPGRRARVLWNNCHTAAMEEYGIHDAVKELYHPDAKWYID